MELVVVEMVSQCLAGSAVLMVSPVFALSLVSVVSAAVLVRSPVSGKRLITFQCTA